MKGDFSRSSFDKSKHYHKVKIQQGRVQVDADWNEQVDIQSYHNIISLSDIIGQSGTSTKDAFNIQAQGATYTVGKGRYYIGGLVAENDEFISDGITWQQERHLPSIEGVLPEQKSVRGLVSPKDDGFYIAFLEVWEHPLTALEDPEIREPALGGPDTSMRVKTLWQVKLLYAGVNSPQIIGDAENISNLFSVPGWAELTDTRVGKLAARARPVEGREDDMCVIPLSAGYSGIENQLYRVEIHGGGEPGKGATFKFAKNNATTVARITKITGDKISISGTAKDASLGFAEGKIGEITDDRHEMWGFPGVLGSLTVDPNDTSTVTFKPDDGVVIQEANFPPRYNPKIRMWDRKDNVIIPSDNDGFISLEHGIEIKFDANSYRSGEYWLIPARSFMLNKSSLTEESTLGDILWPKSNGNPRFMPSEGAPHHVWPLALLQFQAGNFQLKADYRQIFPALEDLVSFQYVGGDGQKAGPGQMVAAPLSAGVSLGDKPLSGVFVTFNVKTGTGLVFPQNDQSAGGGERSLTLVTDASGLAQCYFKIDDQTTNQVVEAFMVDAFGKRVHLPILFSASLTVDSQSPGLNARSNVVSLTIPAQSHTIVGPFSHGANQLSQSTVPPAIILGQTNGVSSTIDEKIVQMEALTDIMMLNSRFGTTQPSSNVVTQLANQTGFNQILSSTNGENVPIFFKPIQIDHLQFYILVINYNKKPTQLRWTESWMQIEREGIKIQQMAIGKNQDKRLEIVAIKDDGQVAYLTQIEPNGNWASWNLLPGIKATQVSIASNQDGRLEIFAIDENGLVFHSWQTSPNSDRLDVVNIQAAWSGWSQFGDVRVLQLAVGQNQDGRLEVFVIQQEDQQIWHRSQLQPNSDWNSWSTLPSMQVKLKAKKVTVASNQDGRLEVFVIGSPVKMQITEPVKAGFQIDAPIRIARSNPMMTFRAGVIGGSASVPTVGRIGIVSPPPGPAAAGDVAVARPPGDVAVARPPGPAAAGDVAVARPPGDVAVARPPGPAAAGDVAVARPPGDVAVARPPGPAAAGDVAVARPPGPAAAGDVVINRNLGVNFDRAIFGNTGVVGPIFDNTGVVGPIPPRIIVIDVNTDDDAVWHRWQNDPNSNSWSDWEILSGLKATQLIVASNQDGRLEIFAIRSRVNPNDLSSLHHRYQMIPNARSSFNWSAWINLGGNPEQMAITRDDDGRLEVFVLARRNWLILSSGITVDSQAVISVLEREGITNSELVEKRTVNEIFVKNALISKWEPQAAVTTTDEHKIKSLLNMRRIPDFIVQSSVYRISQTDPNGAMWTGWDSLGGGDIHNLAVSTNAIDQMMIFAIDASNDLWTLTQLPFELPVSIRWWAIPTASTST